MKSYLRYEPSTQFGVISSPSCNSEYDYTGNLAFTGAGSLVHTWNLRQASCINAMGAKEPSYPYAIGGEASILKRSPSRDNPMVAVGYTNGVVRLFNYLTESLVCSLKGHRSAITSLCYDDDGALLVTGSGDSDIVLWDLVTHTALSRLRGHKDAVHGVGFISALPSDATGAMNKNKARRLLVSVSKDTLLKVWDLDSCSCVQTVVGHRCEIWSLLVHRTEVGDGSQEELVLTGAADELIRGYRVVTSGDDLLQVLVPIGSVERQRPTGTDKCSSLSANPAGTLVAAQSSGKIVEIFRLRSNADAKKKHKRRTKRASQKLLKVGSADVESVAEAECPLADRDSADRGMMLSDWVEALYVLRCAVKVRSFSFDPRSGDKALVGLINNSLEIYRIPPFDPDATTYDPQKTAVIDAAGHRSDVRGLSVSGDGSALASCSSDSVKLWSTRTPHSCISTCRVAGYCLCIAFAPGGRHVIAGTKEGLLVIFDSASGESIFQSPVSDGGEAAAAVWSIHPRPDGKGFMTGGADKAVTFWDFVVTEKGIGASRGRKLSLSHDVLCVRYSPSRSQDRLLVAVGLLDSTVRVYHEDTLRFSLSLYGHKLPVMCLDMSTDCALLVSGSADKTLKIWGLDFGDCHRSMVAHEDSVTAVLFQPETHYFFSAGKDGVCKYWDADRFEQILVLPGHRGSVWSLGLSPDAARLYSCGQDRSIRLWARTEDLVFVEEERERAVEAQVEIAAEQSLQQEEQSSYGVDGSASVGVASKGIESVKGGEALMEALDLVESELANWKPNPSSSNPSSRHKRLSNPLLLGLTPLPYMLRALRMIKAPDLEQALLVLPFHYTSRLIDMLIKLARRGLDIELCAKCSVHLMRCHQSQLLHTSSLLPQMLRLRNILTESIGSYRTLIGMNVAGLRNAKRRLDSTHEDRLMTSTDSQ